MKVLLSLGSVVLAVVLTACGGIPKRPEAVRDAPEGRVVEVSDSVLRAGAADTVDLGRVREGEKVKTEMTLRNTGDRPFVILNAETSCGCTSTEYDKQPVRPGGEARFAFEFNSAGFAGWQVKTISIRTSLGAKPYRIVLTADVH